MVEEAKRRKKIVPNKTPMPEQPPQVRRFNFQEVSLGYTPEMAMQEASRCLQCKKPGCVTGCPVNVPIPRFIKAIREGDFSTAIGIIKETNFLPAVCGRVCPQECQCEKNCVLAGKYEPVGIGRLERFAADESLKNGGPKVPKVAPSTGRKIAVIGSGPSGLTCAFDLARKGHRVVVFEALHEPGGVLVYGIPEFRLPKKIVRSEIEALKKMGVEIMNNAVAGRLFSIDEVMKEYDACFIGTGAGLPKFMGIEGENLNGVYSANEFLTRINLMRAYRFPDVDTPVKRGNCVAVFGGGNVALDAARTALRIGASEVMLIYRRSLAELPARKEEVLHAREEGIRFELCANPVRIIGDDQGLVRAVESVRMDLCELDGSGRRSPKPIQGSEFTIPVDVAIVALGTGANLLASQGMSSVQVNEKKYIIADEETGRTCIEGVYAGGDIVTGSATVISAMGAGRKAAKAMHDYLAGKT
ncbi:MAG: glutamate synthase (NADPH), homotetrameric [Nitrospirae bacterium GWC2_57_13]|nr:MAG: glutamate synthase (NADPH), homotetrameric [Nitrospirae bacterium GWC1_57_7]OGW29320.1 MAG: glutamate synthase (NADPH), homotetrameric [Nitrospirae bacterium GWC2_57_13]HAR44800.1 glutamate synthase (NADPH), homotetrameric [Nitrospiraceae bacterium]HAS55010.1 glutamate synthase (NADPH), homotetrameric [Nitrospiraceae bacterium]